MIYNTFAEAGITLKLVPEPEDPEVNVAVPEYPVCGDTPDPVYNLHGTLAVSFHLYATDL